MNPHIEGLLDLSLFNPVRDFKKRQGKRIRGLLLQASYELAGGIGKIPASIGDAIESLHAGSLVIDDIQDNSNLRRGSATMHRRIGVPLAINAGNWMYFQALEFLTEAPFPPEMRFRLVEAMICAARRCHEGQALDLFARVDQIPVEKWEETTHTISLLKTGSLVELAVRMGCISADSPDQLLSVMPHLGQRLGIALQMRNDLDEIATIARGYPASYMDTPTRDDDLRNARLSWPWVWAAKRIGVAKCHKLTSQLVRNPDSRQPIAKKLLEMVGDYGDQIIGGVIREQMQRLADYVVDKALLHDIAEILQSIEPRTRPASIDEPLSANSGIEVAPT
jgi:geranylgeranyl pyrophosphate synthase